MTCDHKLFRTKICLTVYNKLTDRKKDRYNHSVSYKKEDILPVEKRIDMTIVVVIVVVIAIVVDNIRECKDATVRYSERTCFILFFNQV